MFKEIVKILTEKKTLIDDMSKQFISMLEISREMYVSTTDLLCLGGNSQAVKKKIYPADKKLNKMEQKIRREVVTHISVSGSTNLASMLIFMAIARDAERIGDNIKNIYDLNAKTKKDFCAVSIGKDALKIRNFTVEKMDEIVDIFSKSGTKKAKQYVESTGKLMKVCDKALDDLVRNGDKIESAVVYTLFFRYSKRILAHLSNIATSVIMPVDKLDYFDEVKYQ